MSMPYTIYECSGCDFKAFSTVLWGNFTYRHGDERIQIQRELGWCAQCGTLVPVESLPTLPDLHEKEARCEVMRGHLDTLRREARSKQGFLARVLGLGPTADSEMVAQQLDLQFLEDDIQLERRRLEALEHRVSPPKCLLCGSTEVKKQIGSVEHPGCGGKIDSRPSEARVSIRMKSRTYDLEGSLLDESWAA